MTWTTYSSRRQRNILRFWTEDVGNPNHSLNQTLERKINISEIAHTTAEIKVRSVTAEENISEPEDITIETKTKYKPKREREIRK